MHLTAQKWIDDVSWDIEVGSCESWPLILGIRNGFAILKVKRFLVCYIKCQKYKLSWAHLTARKWTDDVIWGIEVGSYESWPLTFCNKKWLFCSERLQRFLASSKKALGYITKVRPWNKWLGQHESVT